MRSSIKRQDGVALPVVAGVLLLIAILTGSIAAQAIRSSDEANNDRSSKRALSAAEAGLRVAVFRLNRVKPLDSECMRSHPSGSYTIAPLPSLECPTGEQESIGNEGNFSYVVSTVGASGCGALPGIPAPGLARCVTATGTVNGVTRRIQERVARKGIPLFADGGMIGLDLIDMENSAEIFTDIGTNGHIELRNSIAIDPGALLLAPGATYNIGSSTVSGGVQPHAPFVAPPIDFEPSRLSNNNSVLPPSIYNSATREFVMGDSAEYEIPPGVYNLCNMTFTNNNMLRQQASGLVQIYIDSPARPLSGCAPGTGRLQGGNSTEINEEVGNSENLEIYVYGTNNESPTRPDVQFVNSTKLRGVLYAPNSTIENKNSAQFKAAFIARNILFRNSEQFELPNSLKKKKFGIDGPYADDGWFECRATPTNPSDPESGC
jgi:Tfp pilus assembly protein PilX